MESSDPVGVSYHVADVTRPSEWWDGIPFDGAVCEMALMDIDDLSGTFRAVASDRLEQADGSRSSACTRAFPATRSVSRAGRQSSLVLRRGEMDVDEPRS